MKDLFLLDMDDTLLDFPRAEAANVFHTLAQFGIEADGGMIARFHRINDDLWKALERGETTREKLKEQRFAALFCEYAVSADVPAVARAYCANFPEVCFPFEGSAEFLKELSRRGRVYLCTNGGTEIQKRHIALAGFTPYLSGAFISEEIGAVKPSRAYADCVAAYIAGYEPSRAVYLGDSVTSDRKCAEEMGVDFVLFAPRGIPAGYAGNAAETYAEALRIIGSL